MRKSAGVRAPGPGASSVLEVRDPADQRCVVAEVPAMGADDVAAAYERARAGIAAWRRASPLDRAAVLSAAAGLIRSKAEDGAVTLVRENGKTLAEARVEVAKTADFLDFYASFARQPIGEILADARAGTQTTVRCEPVGVVLAITPWNDPLLTPARKLGPALIAGNAVVLKPARQTPVIARWLADQLASAGLPGGVLGLVTGRDQDISGALLGHPDQRCTATSRLIADSAIAPGLLERLRGRAASAVLGPGLDPASTLGPLATPEHRDGILGHIGRATADGADMITGGARPAARALQHGCYVEPTIISVSPLHALWRDEVFGPVVAVCQASGFEEAVKLANDSRYGLSAAVFTTSLRLASEFIERAEAGQVAVNLPTSGWDVHHPFGGFRDSGSAFKEQGATGLRFYTRLKTAAVRFAW